jgi:uncharacterized protein YgbK (DUF1537 family)
MAPIERPKIVVLDDDPTGSQTVHSCLLLTEWDEETLHRASDDDSPLFFVLTNTRSMSPGQAAETTRTVCRNLRGPLSQLETPWLVVSRSDSTLRGHYPVETDVIADELGPFDAHFMTPAFFEGGRITREGTHYVVRDGREVPADETEFARDSVFGYSTAYLPSYVEEKTNGSIRADDVELFGPEESDQAVLARLRRLEKNTCCVVSATRQAELDRFSMLLLQVAGEGKRFLFRSAASLLTSLADLPPQPVAPEDMAHYVTDRRPGLVLVGSHVPLSTRQLELLLETREVTPIEVDVSKIPDTDGSLQRSVIDGFLAAHHSGRTAVVFTSRVERQFDSAEERLMFGRETSKLLMNVVRNAPVDLGFLLSKGGITSNDVLSTGLDLKTARVVGQIHPGCSVVLTPDEHRIPGMPVVIFPGNVGDASSLRLVFDRLTG